MHRIGNTLLLLAALATSAVAAEAPSHQRNPQVVFTTPGLKAVTLTTCNASGCSTVNKYVQVLDPRPTISAASAQPLGVERGRAVTLSATASGKPPLTFDWQVSGPGYLQHLAGNPASWSTGGVPLGSYSVRLTVTNGAGTATAGPLALAVRANSPLAFYTIHPCRLFDSRTSSRLRPGEERTIDLPPACGIPSSARALAGNATVILPSDAGFLTLFPAGELRAETSNLSFRSGQTRAAFSILGLGGAPPRLTAALGMPPNASADLVLDASGYFASDPAHSPPTIGLFSAELCFLSFCIFPVGAPVGFSQTFPDRLPGDSYSYDWEGTGTFTAASTAPVFGHVYTHAGTFTPILRVARGGFTSIYRHPDPMTLAAPSLPPPAPVGVSAAYAGLASTVANPTIQPPAPAFRISAASSPVALIGYDAFVSRNGSAFTFVGTLLPNRSSATDLLVTSPFSATDSVFLVLRAVTYSGLSNPSAPVALRVP